MAYRRWLLAAGILLVVTVVMVALAVPRDAAAQYTVGPVRQVQTPLEVLTGDVRSLMTEDTDRFQGSHALFALDKGGHVYLYTTSHRLQTALEAAVIRDKRVTVHGHKFLLPPDLEQTHGNDVYLVTKVVLIDYTT